MNNFITAERHNKNNLNRLLNRWFIVIWTVHLLAFRSDSTRISVHIEQSANIELRLLKDLHFANVHVLERVEVVASLLDVFADRVWNQLRAHLLQVASGNLNANFI